MRRFRVGYYGTMGVLLIAGLGSGRWEFYFLFTVAALLVVFALALNLWTIFTFSCTQELSARSVVKGAAPLLTVRIHNNKPFAFVGLRLTVQTPPPAPWAQLAINLDPGEGASYEIPLECKYRGAYDVGPAVLEAVDVFGLLHVRFDLRRLSGYTPAQIVVYPRLLLLPTLSSNVHDSAAHKGAGAQRLTTDGESFSDTRKYRFGDPFKRVHRIISVRKRQLYVKRYDLPTETAAIIAVDVGDTGLTGEEALRHNDIACECAAAIANHCLGAGYLTALISSDTSEHVIEGRNVRDFHKFYDQLAVMKFGGGQEVGAALHWGSRSLPNRKMVYVISSREEKSLADTLTGLSQAGNQVRVFMPLAQDGAGQSDKAIAGVSVCGVRSADDIATGLGRGDGY